MLSAHIRVFLAVLIGVLMPTIAHAAEEPPHRVIFASGAIEIRDYEPMILAEVSVEGNMASAGNRGFRPLANYIFGDNQLPGSPASSEIAMTAPVLQERSARIAMTSPVTQARSGEAWQVAFVMPPEWDMNTLPRPNDPDVTLVEVPARRMAAIRFSGGPTEARFARKAEELAAFLLAEGYAPVSGPVYARYDPPWVPTLLRRNEVMIEIAR